MSQLARAPCRVCHGRGWFRNSPCICTVGSGPERGPVVIRTPRVSTGRHANGYWRPATRGDCGGQTACPTCGALVYFIHGSVLSCPACGQRVAYRGGVGAQVGHWENYDPNASGERLATCAGDLPEAVFVKCRPCVFSSCPWNSYLEVHGVDLRFLHPHLYPWQVPPEHSCFLDAFDRGPLTLSQISEILCVTRERVRQIEASALAKMKRYAQKHKGPLDE